MSRLLKSLSLAMLAFGVIFPTTVQAHIDPLNKSIQYDQQGYSLSTDSLFNSDQALHTKEVLGAAQLNAIFASTRYTEDIPPWWKTWWFYAIISIMMLGIFMAIYQIKNNQTKTARIAEQAIRESEEQYRTLFESIPVGIIITTVDSQLVAFNHVFQQMTDYTEEELMNLQLIDTYQDSHDRVRLLAQVEKEGSVNGFEAVFKHKNGSYINVRLTVTPITLAGQPCFLSVVEDITNRKRVEDALEKQIIALTQPLDTEHEIDFEDILSLSDMQQLQDLFAEAFGVAALITTPEGKPITQPSNFTALCGGIIRASEIGSRNCNLSDAVIGRHNISGPNIQPCLSAGLCNAGVSITIGGRHIANWLIGQVRNEAQDEEEIMKYAREIGADEDAFRAAYREVPTMSQEQFERVAHFLFVLANQVSTTAYQNIQQARFITERKRTEEALQQANLVVENSPVVLFRWKPEEGWPVEMVSGNVIQFGYTPEELLSGGVHYASLVHPDDLKRVIRELQDYSQAGTDHFVQEYRVVTKEGAIRWVSDHTAIERDANGQISCYQGIVIDITERKQIEDELRKAQEELEDRVKERTAQLETANKELESFTYSVSHDLRAPLRSMDGFSRILIEDYAEHLPPDAQRYLGLIRNGARKMGSLVDDLLAFSRLGRQPLNKKPVVMNDLVEQTIKSMEEEQGGRHIQVTVGALPDGEGDESMLRQVWVNLLSNAYKFTRNCQVAQIEIGCIETDGKNAYYVKDNGAGFDMQYGHKLFGVFQRLHSEREFEGTGVGLAIVHRIIERHGGSVWAEGSVDNGATFYFSLSGYEEASKD